MSILEIRKASITDLGTDAVVNAANEGLWAGAGVCGAIFAAAGHAQLEEACGRIGHCDTGSAVITPGFRLAKYIIHAVGPRYSDGRHHEAELLYGAYKRSLELARDHECLSIGFPLISAGIFGYPLEGAWQEAIRACTDFVNENPDYDIRIVFAILSDEIIECGKSVMDGMSAHDAGTDGAPVKRSDWKNVDMPDSRDAFILKRAFSKKEMMALRKGHIPEAMEDKWFWYMEGDTLYIHRSWTGFCIYIAELSDGYTHKVTVNRDSEQYASEGAEADCERLNKLLDYMIRQPFDYYTEWIEETADSIKKAKKGD
ncbi:MAG: macro domain-containing protein [Lachnospiraceae bacterium]|nr:macro domain-containing protein [Lachnospiraceae bacterium]